MTPPGVSGAPAGKWVIASTVLLGSFVSVMDVSIVNVATPQMLGTFGVSLDEITWVSVAYSIAEIILVTMAAWWSARLGRKRFYMLSFGLFTGASVLCGSARSLEMMILARLLQGIGGGGLIPLSQAIMLETFSEAERGMAMALYSMGVTVAPTVGPVLGGWLTDTYSWSWVFYINVPVGFLGVGMAALVLRDPPTLHRSRARVDGVGIGLLAIRAMPQLRRWGRRRVTSQMRRAVSAAVVVAAMGTIAADRSADGAGTTVREVAPGPGVAGSKSVV